MNDKEKKIEEFAEDIRRTQESYGSTNVLLMARSLYNDRYRKLSDTEIVIDKDKYERLCRGQECLDRFYTDILQEQLEKVRKEARLEAAKEIYQQLQGHGTTSVKKWIKNNYGLEVEEWQKK